MRRWLVDHWPRSGSCKVAPRVAGGRGIDGCLRSRERHLPTLPAWRSRNCHGRPPRFGMSRAALLVRSCWRSGCWSPGSSVPFSACSSTTASPNGLLPRPPPRPRPGLRQPSPAQPVRHADQHGLVAALWLYAMHPSSRARRGLMAAALLLLLPQPLRRPARGCFNCCPSSAWRAFIARRERRGWRAEERVAAGGCPRRCCLLATIPLYFAIAWALPHLVGGGSGGVESMLQRLHTGAPDDHSRLILWHNVLDADRRAPLDRLGLGRTQLRALQHARYAGARLRRDPGQRAQPAAASGSGAGHSRRRADLRWLSSGWCSPRGLGASAIPLA